MRLSSELPVTTGNHVGFLAAWRGWCREDLVIEWGDRLLDFSRPKNFAVIETWNWLWKWSCSGWSCRVAWEPITSRTISPEIDGILQLSEARLAFQTGEASVRWLPQTLSILCPKSGSTSSGKTVESGSGTHNKEIWLQMRMTVLRAITNPYWLLTAYWALCWEICINVSLTSPIKPVHLLTSMLWASPAFYR